LGSGAAASMLPYQRSQASIRVVSPRRAGPRRFVRRVHRALQWRLRRRAETRGILAAAGFPNLVRARAAKAEKRRQRLLGQWQREKLKRTPFALLDDPPEELRPTKGRK